MDTTDIDRRLRALYERNSPPVDETALLRRLKEAATTGRGVLAHRDRRRKVALAVGCFLAVCALAVGVYEAAHYLGHERATLVITDDTIGGPESSTYTSVARFSAQIVLTGSPAATRPSPQEVVLSGPWGSMPGQFGLDQGTCCSGPSAMAVSESGSSQGVLAVADTVNSRVQVYMLGDDGKARLEKSIDLPDVSGGLNDMVIDSFGNIYALRGQEEILALRADADEVQRFAIDPDIGALRLHLWGAVLFLEGADGNSRGVAIPSRSVEHRPVGYAAYVHGVPVGTTAERRVLLGLNGGRLSVRVSTAIGGETRELELDISSPDLPIDSASVLGADHVSNVWLLLHICKQGWDGTESLLAVAISDQGEKVAELRLPLDGFATQEVVLGPTFPFTIYEMRGTPDSLSINRFTDLIKPLTTTTEPQTWRSE